MLNIHELERSWLRYKIKQSLPRIAVGFVLITASGILYYWSSFSDRPLDTIKKDNTTLVVSSTTTIASAKNSREESTPLTTPVPKTLPPPKAIGPTASSEPKAIEVSSIQDDNEPSRILRPSIDFMDTIKNDVSRTDERPIQRSSTKEALSPRPTIIPQPLEKAIETKKIKETPPHIEEVPEKSTIVSMPQKSAITITTKQDEADIKEVIRRFKKNKNPALSLFIARQYYKTGRYQNAYNYALITNNINSDIEDSWLIFARSLVKLDQTDMAKKALLSYISNSDSARAKMLLDDIIQGKFR